MCVDIKNPLSNKIYVLKVDYGITYDAFVIVYLCLSLKSINSQRTGANSAWHTQYRVVEIQACGQNFTVVLPPKGQVPPY